MILSIWFDPLNSIFSLLKKKLKGDIIFKMKQCVLIETKRIGEISIKPGVYGNLKVVSNSPIFTAFSQIKIDDPNKNFSFKIPCNNDDVLIFEYPTNENVMGRKFFEVELKTSNKDLSLFVQVLYITPFNGLQEKCDVAFSPHFTIGHRGSGSNLVVKDFLENSIGGFENAFKNGAEFVEFDIQLSKENVPVIYHDFYIKAEKDIGHPLKIEDDGTYKYALNQLTTEQFENAGLLSQWKQKYITYADLLKKLPKDLKFDVELKYPFLEKFLDVPYAERNLFIDQTLNEMKKFAYDRELFFSSFDVATVIMLSFKQKRWPIFQLMNRERGETLNYFVRKTMNVAPLLKEIGVKGFVFNNKYLLQAPTLIKELKDMGFIIATYGMHNNTVEGINKQLDLGIRGLCTDLMPQLRKTVDMYELESE